MVTKVSTLGQIEIPAELREQDKIVPGEEFEFERLEEGDYRLKRKPAQTKMGLYELLRSCPHQGWFTPFDRTETIDDIRIPNFE